MKRAGSVISKGLHKDVQRARALVRQGHRLTSAISMVADPGDALRGSHPAQAKLIAAIFGDQLPWTVIRRWNAVRAQF